MRVALLVPGDSIATSWSNTLGAQFDAVVAVNWCAHHFTCDWAVGMDHLIMSPILEGTVLRPSRGVVTRRAYAPGALRARLQHIDALPYLGKFEGRTFSRAAQRERCGYTMPNALWWCGKLGATHLEVFGFDMSGSDGFKAQKRGSHNLGRWAREAAWLRGYWLPGTIVHGLIKPERLAYIEGKRTDWPG